MPWTATAVSPRRPVEPVSSPWRPAAQRRMAVPLPSSSENHVSFSLTDKAVQTGMQVLRRPLVAKHYQARWRHERNRHVKYLNHVNMPKHTSSTTVRWCVKSWPLPLFPPFAFLDGQYQKCMALESCEMLKMNAYIDMKCCSEDMCNTFDNSV